MAEAAIAPSQPATASPAPGIIESAPKTSADTFPGLSADLDNIIGKSGLGTPESEKRVSKGSRQPKSVEKKPEAEQKPEAKLEEKQPEAKAEQKTEEKPAEKKPDQADEKKTLGPWQRVHAAEREVKELRAKVAELENRKPTDDPEKIEYKTKWEKAEEQRRALDDEMRYVNYERSSEFQDKYYKPYVSTWERAIGQVKDLKLNNPDGTVRNATPDDLARIVQIPSNEEALVTAEELFGNPTKAAFVIGLRNQLREAHHAMEAAKIDFRAKGDERQKEWERQQSEQQQSIQKQMESDQKLWAELNASALEKHKEWFVAAEDDKEGAELLRQGFELADLAWNGSDKLPREKLIALRSAERNKAAGFRYMVHKVEKANARIAELEKELSEFQKSEPGNGEARSDEKKDGWDIDAAIARIPRV